MSNVKYDKINAADLAAKLKVEPATVQRWCKEGRINCVNVSGGVKSGRWQIDEEEANYIRHLVEKFGSVRMAMFHYRKDWRDGQRPAAPVNFNHDKKPEVIGVLEIKTEPVVKDEVTELAKTIIYARQVKARIEDCKNELSLLEKEYEDLKKEIMEEM